VENLSGRSVFFVKDAERALRCYTDTLGFNLTGSMRKAGGPSWFRSACSVSSSS